MNNKVIGIISYLPNDLRVRETRKRKLIDLVNSCARIFPHVPIMIIAQSWGDFRLDGANVMRYDRLGILGARRELRRVFLQSEYEYLIMLDDDCRLFGGPGDEYLRQIDENPGMFYEFKKTLLKLFCIHRSIFDDYPAIDPEKGEGFEDRAFVGTLRKTHADKRYVMHDTGVFEESVSTDDPNSTWSLDRDNRKMLLNTEEYLKNVKC